MSWHICMSGSAFSSPPETPCWGANGYIYDVWWSMRYEEFLVLTPQAGAFVRGGQALADGTIRGSSSRLLVEFLLERYELYAHRACKMLWFHLLVGRMSRWLAQTELSVSAPHNTIFRLPRHVESCELSLDPEVAILFGREIGQSNDCWNLQG